MNPAAYHSVKERQKVNKKPTFLQLVEKSGKIAPKAEKAEKKQTFLLDKQMIFTPKAEKAEKSRGGADGKIR